MQNKFSSLINDLSWDMPDDIQKDAIKSLLQIPEEEVPILTRISEKKCWENAAIVLKEIGYPRNKLALPGLIEWLQDMNWPGSTTAADTLRKIDIKILVPYIEEALLKAFKEEDYIWMTNIKELVINKLKLKKSDFDKRELYELLKLGE
jgi:hypothetical protein